MPRTHKLLLVALLLFGCVPALAQSNPNEEQGLKPYDSLHGGDLDKVSLTTGGLFIQVPLASFPQRGDLNLSFSARFSSKQWFVRTKCSGVTNPICASVWLPAPSSGTQIVSSVDWWMQTSNSANPDGGYDWSRAVTSPDGNAHGLGGQTAVPNGALYPLRSLDTTGLLHTDTHTLILPNGTRYSYPNMSDNLNFNTGGTTGYVEGIQPRTITDSNGNQITITSSGWTDTLGRAILGYAPGGGSAIYPVQPGVPTSDLSTCPAGTASALVWNVPGVSGVNNGVRTFKFCYAMFSIATNFQVSNVSEYSASMSLLSAVVLPDLTMWTFNYDNYADITRLGFPTGGSISYTYRKGPTTSSSGTSTSMFVASRTVDDGTGGHTWNYAYSGQATTNGYSGTATVTTPDGNDAVHTVATPSPSPGIHGSIYEIQAQYYQGPASTGTLLKTVATSYSGNVSPTNDYLDIVPTQATVTLPGGQTSKVINTYDTATTNGDGNPVIIGSLLQRDEYDFSNSLVRSTLNHFLWQDNSTYKSNNFVSLAVSTTIKDGAGNQVAQTAYAYDQTAVTSSGVTTQLVAPPAGGSIRGNVTTVSRWLSTTNSMIPAAATYFDTGMKASSTDPLGHTASYTYSSAFGGAYMTQTNLPDTGSVHHIISGNYDFNTGLLTSFTDQNSKTYSYQYDIMLRLTQGNHPDGGQTVFNYPNPTTVERQRLIASGSTTVEDYFAYFDGVGRNTRTQQVIPNGNVYVDTTYDSAGRTATVSNPYSATTDPTYGITQSQYDGLSRTTKVVPADGTSSANNVSTIYTNNCTTVTDQAGKTRKACTDALGRLIEVDEPNPGAAATNATGWVSVSGAEQSATSQPATSGSGTVTISGTEQSGSYCPGIRCVTIHDSGTVSITVNGLAKSVSYSFTGNNTSSLVASALASAFNGDANSPVNASSSSNVVTLTAKVTGASTNYSLSATAATSDTTGTFAGPSFWPTASGSTLTGGHDAASVSDSGTITATINGTAYSVTFGAGDTSSSIASRLASAISAGAFANASASGGTVNLTSKTPGTAGDYSLSASYTWNSGQFTNPSFTTSTSGSALTGALDASTLNNNPYVTLYTYDTLNNLTCAVQKGPDTTAFTSCTAAPATWRARSFVYDSLSRLTSSTNPESGSISYAYDNDGNLLTKTAPSPNQTGTATVTTTYSYDALNRLTAKSFSDTTPAVTYSYDAGTNGIGRRTGMTDAAGSESWSYDSMGRPLTDQRTTNGVTKTTSYAYNLLGGVTTLTNPSGRTITYAFDSAARPISAVDQVTGISYANSAAYSPTGALSSLTNGSGIISTFYYDKRLQPCRISVKSTGTAPGNCGDTTNIGNVLDFTYNFSLGSADNGNVTGIANNRDTTRSQNFTYDVLNRIATGVTTSTYATSPAHCWGESFNYDAWGNLLAIGGVSGYTGCTQESLSVSATTKNQLSGYGYDAAGNMTSIPSVASYTYNAAGQLTSAAGVTYAYDGDGKRVQKSSGKLYWYGMGTRALDESDASGNIINEYVFFAGKRIARRDSSGNVSYYFADHLGTARVVTNSSGAILDDSDFYPFGGERPIVSSSGNTYKFTGKERDSESGLDDFGARYYSSALGRFISNDPGGAYLDDPQSWNRYAYALNNPLFYVDPNGAESVSAITQIGTASLVAYVPIPNGEADPSKLLVAVAGVIPVPLGLLNQSQSMIGKQPMSSDSGGGCVIFGCLTGYDAMNVGVNIDITFSYDEKTGEATKASVTADIDYVGAPTTKGGKVKWNPYPNLVGPQAWISAVNINPTKLRGLSDSELRALEREVRGKTDPVSIAIQRAIELEKRRRQQIAEDEKKKEKKPEPKPKHGRFEM